MKDQFSVHWLSMRCPFEKDYTGIPSAKKNGTVNTGINEDSDSTEEASECFVILLTAINDAWKLPVSFWKKLFLITGENKAHLVQICIEMVEETGINSWIKFIKYSVLRMQNNDAFRTMFQLLRYCSVPDFFAILRARTASFCNRLRSNRNAVLATTSQIRLRNSGWQYTEVRMTNFYLGSYLVFNFYISI